MITLHMIVHETRPLKRKLILGNVHYLWPGGPKAAQSRPKQGKTSSDGKHLWAMIIIDC